MRKSGPVCGFHHHHSDDDLRRYRALSAEQKLAWLYAAWRFTSDFLPAKNRARFESMRRGLDPRFDRGHRGNT